MASKSKAELRRHQGPDLDGFDVTVQSVIGRVEFGAGDRHPHVIAMGMIGEHATNDGTDGQYAFPGEDGREFFVTVERGPYSDGSRPGDVRRPMGAE